MKGPKTGKSQIDLHDALKEAAKQIVDKDALGLYKVEFFVIVDNPKIREYHATITLAEPLQVQGLAEEHLLGEEAVEQGDARHGPRRDHRQQCRVGHVPVEAVELAQVSTAALVIDDTCGHEERRLEHCVIDDVEDGRDLPERGAKGRIAA